MKKLEKTKDIEKRKYLEQLGIKYSKILRIKATYWESIFYKILEDLHYKFLFQVPKILKIKGGHKLYILDFLLTDYPLVIEVDGVSIHHTKAGKKRDATRTRLLKKEGLDVLRFTNSQVSTLSKEEIQRIIETRIQNYC